VSVHELTGIPPNSAMKTVISPELRMADHATSAFLASG
jgi:hypothetical protein